MTNIERLPACIIEDIRGNTPFDKGDFTDEEINKMSNHKLFNHWLNWNGFLGYATLFEGVVEDIFNVELNKD